MWHSFPEGKFGTIVVDPPWQFANTSSRGSAEDHYKTLEVGQLALLPVEAMAADQAHLYLWTTDTHMQAAFWLMQQWGFTYKQNLVWVKVNNGKLQMGMGNYYRHAHELLLFGTRGSCKAEAHNLMSVFWAPRGEHSVKPDALYTMAETLSPGPRADIFARRKRDNWICWGNQLED